MQKKINIIGAGIAGLSVGCYLQMVGYATEIFELHTSPGGLCTSWKRKEYTIDGCIHWLVGSSPNHEFYEMWNEIIDMKNLKFVDFDIYGRMEDKEGNYINIYTNVDKLENELLTKAPEDKDLILDFIKAIRKFTKFKPPALFKAPETYNFSDMLKMIWSFIPYGGLIKKWLKIDALELSKKCKNKLLSKTFEFMFQPNISAIVLIMMMSWMHQKCAGYPIGGSLNFSKLFEKKYLELGGKINYNSKVVKIITERTDKISRACGIELENGQTHKCDLVISAADGYDTIFRMLEGRYQSNRIKNFYNDADTFPSYLQVSLGVKSIFDDEVIMSLIPLKEKLFIDDSISYDNLFYRIYSFDNTLAPPGKTLIVTMFPTYNYKYWCELRKNDPEKYKSEKQRIADATITTLEGKYGNVKNNVEMVDVSTPASIIRYTNNWKGSFEGWMLSPKIGFKRLSKTLPGLGNFYMIGQWVEPGGGIPTVLNSGRNVAQIICKKDKIKFPCRIK